MLLREYMCSIFVNFILLIHWDKTRITNKKLPQENTLFIQFENIHPITLYIWIFFRVE